MIEKMGIVSSINVSVVLQEDKVCGQKRTPKPVPSPFRALFPQSRVCLRSPEENEKTQRRQNPDWL